MIIEVPLGAEEPPDLPPVCVRSGRTDRVMVRRVMLRYGLSDALVTIALGGWLMGCGIGTPVLALCYVLLQPGVEVRLPVSDAAVASVRVRSVVWLTLVLLPAAWGLAVAHFADIGVSQDDDLAWFFLAPGTCCAAPLVNLLALWVAEKVKPYPRLITLASDSAWARIQVHPGVGEAMRTAPLVRVSHTESPLP